MQYRNKQQQNFYSDNNSLIKGQGETYGKAEFEALPLSRVNKTCAPGNKWVNQGKGVTLKDWVVTDSVRIWQVAISNTPGIFSTYSCEFI